MRGPGKGLVRRDYQHLTPETARTAGEVLYLRHGVTGVRGQAEAGFPAVREVGLPVLEESLRQGLSWNDAVAPDPLGPDGNHGGYQFDGPGRHRRPKQTARRRKRCFGGSRIGRE